MGRYWLVAWLRVPHTEKERVEWMVWGEKIFVTDAGSLREHGCAWSSSLAHTFEVLE